MTQRHFPVRYESLSVAGLEADMQIEIAQGEIPTLPERWPELRDRIGRGDEGSSAAALKTRGLGGDRGVYVPDLFRTDRPANPLPLIVRRILVQTRSIKL